MRACALLAGLLLLGCGASSSPPRTARARPVPPAAVCASVGSDLAAFGEALETASVDAKARAVTYAGLLELLLSFERAATDLDTELATLQPSNKEVASRLRTARDALGRSERFARTERGTVEKHARELVPLARETQQAWAALRASCESGPAKKGPPECAPVRDVLAKFDAAETTADHDRAVADLSTLKLMTPAVARSRDRAVAASRAVQAALRAHVETTSMPRRWASVQKELSGAMDGLASACTSDGKRKATKDGAGGGAGPGDMQLAAAAAPDPRKLTVLVHTKPPAAVERSLLALALGTKDADERAFYQARAEGAFGSGFVLVHKTAKGDDVLVVTNRHVVELGDKPALALADGTPLGPAEIVYSSPVYDLAILRPRTKLDVTEGFALSPVPAKDQQTVIATGFPGLGGRPSYQTTRGYVSNQSFKLDDGTRPLTYVQHTAPIDPGSSGGPLTDESGHVLGVNTLKVTGREGVGLAVPSRYVVDTMRTAGSVEAHQGSAQHRQGAARLACLAFLAELGAPEPRMLVLEQMISNELVGAEGLEAASALASEEGFEHLWNDDSVRAMRIATLVKLRAAMLAGGGPSAFETCDDLDAASSRPDAVKYRVRLGNFETRDLALRWEHGRWKIDGLSSSRGAPPPPTRPASPRKLPPPGPPTGAARPKRGVAPPRPKR